MRTRRDLADSAGDQLRRDGRASTSSWLHFVRVLYINESVLIYIILYRVVIDLQRLWRHRGGLLFVQRVYIFYKNDKFINKYRLK